jgi:hypothetical protein
VEVAFVRVPLSFLSIRLGISCVFSGDNTSEAFELDVVQFSRGALTSEQIPAVRPERTAFGGQGK